MTDRPGMTEKEWRLLRTVGEWHGGSPEIQAALASAQAERDAATKPTPDEVFRARGEALRPEMEAMAVRDFAPGGFMHGLMKAEGPTPQPEGASRRERLHNLIVAKTQYSLWTAYGLADAILAALGSKLT